MTLGRDEHLSDDVIDAILDVITPRRGVLIDRPNHYGNALDERVAMVPETNPDLRMAIPPGTDE